MYSKASEYKHDFKQEPTVPAAKVPKFSAGKAFKKIRDL